MSKKSPARSGQKKPTPRPSRPAAAKAAAPSAAVNGAPAAQGGLGAAAAPAAPPPVVEEVQAPAPAPVAAAAPPLPAAPEEDLYIRKMEFATGQALAGLQLMSHNGVPPKMCVQAFLRVVGMGMEVFKLWGELSVAEEVQSGRDKQRAFMAGTEQARAQAEADMQRAEGRQPS